MKSINIDRDWSLEHFRKDGRKTVHLPHDYMLENEVAADAPGSSSMGYYNAGIASYTKYLDIPADWNNEKIFLRFDGIMMNADIEVNGNPVAAHHYGYTPFTADITSSIFFGEQNRVKITVNPTMQPNSRWYSGAGILRHVTLVHAPRIHIAENGIFTYTRQADLTENGASYAQISTEVTIANETLSDHLVQVDVQLIPDTFDGSTITRSTSILVRAGQNDTARVLMSVSNPTLWSADAPELYRVTATAADLGEFGIRLLPAATPAMCDEESVLFGIRTLTADAVHGLRINGHSIKLKGGCIHHDNGLLGAASFYDSEYRRIKKLRESGYNAVRLAHNPPSAVLLEACDRLGMYVLDEAFDAWGIGKMPGDYNQYFRANWKKDMTSFILRDRNHPSILFWSTGNEVPERGGLGGGYTLAAQLANYIRSLDSTRLITNGMCIYAGGLDDKTPAAEVDFEQRSEPFLNALDVVGYNYLDNLYEESGSLHPDRVLLGTESFPQKIDQIWSMVERLPYLIGDFTWTAYEYLGEAGVGKSVFLEPDDPTIGTDKWTRMAFQSPFPWRLANDSDYDFNGGIKPQGVYRKIVWGSTETGVFAQNPANYTKTEIISKWGWPELFASWNWDGWNQKPIRVTVYSASSEVELFLNGKSLGKKDTGKENRYTAIFEFPYAPGNLTAVSLQNGHEVSRTSLATTGKAAALRLTPETDRLTADGDNLAYIAAEIVDADGNVVPDAAYPVTVKVSGAATLAAFGSAATSTTENYTTGHFTTCQGRAMAILRAGCNAGEVTLTAECAGLPDTSVTLPVIAHNQNQES